MTAPARYLSDNFAPVEHEVTATDLQLIGELPADLCGRYLRNGPNPLGSVNEAKLYAKMIADPSSRTQAVETVMQGAFPFLDITAPVDALALMLTPENPAVLVRDFKTDETWVITRSDVIQVLS